MARAVTTHVVDAAGLEHLRQPRDDLVAEVADGDDAFALGEGPMRRYRRTLDVSPVDGDRFEVRDVVDFSLAVRFWGVLAVWPVKRALRHRSAEVAAGNHRHVQPWWAPPQRLDARAAQVLGVLCTASVVTGYLGTLLTQTITFATEEFGADNRGQGIALATVRLSILLALVLMAASDRRGRRPLLLATVGGGCVTAAVGALSPSLPWLTAAQTVSRGFSIALGLLITIIAAEEMPKGARAYAISLLAMTAALGAGMAVWLLPLADLAEAAWRILFVVPLLALFLLPGLARLLPESRRFDAPHGEVTMAGHGRRFWLLAVSAFFVQLFVAPASQFQNEFLRDERAFSAARITLFTLLTNTPAGIGIVVAGRIADIRGRRLVGAVGLAGGVGATVVMYLVSGWELWAWSVVGAVVGAATVPALGVYGPELFPTSLRGRANGTIGILSVLGAVCGLLLVGVLSEELDGLGPAISLMAIGPLVTTLLVLFAYPETAHLELEELNPEDRTGGRLSSRNITTP